MSGLTPTQAAGLLKKAYDPRDPEQQVYTRFPFFTLLKKRTNVGGEDFTIPCVYAANPRVGTVFATASGITETAPAAKFALSPRNIYGVFEVEGKVFAQTGDVKKQAAAFMPIITERAKSTMKSVEKLAAVYAARNGTGSVGRVASTTVLASTVLVLTNASDAFGLEEGMQIQLTDTDGGTLRSAGATATISSIPGDGTLVLSANLSTSIAAAALGDYVVIKGDLNHSIPGLKSWCPFSSTKGTFAGVARDAAPRKLAGLYLDAVTPNLTIDVAIARGLNMLKANEGTCTNIWLNPADYESLCQTGATQVMADQGDERVFGFKSVSFKSDGMSAKVYEDPTIPAGEAWLTDMNALEFVFAGDEIDFLDKQDDQMILRVPSSDSYEGRIGAYPNGLTVRNPGRAICGIALY